MKFNLNSINVLFQKKLRLISYFLIFFSAFVSDQLSKWLILMNLDLANQDLMPVEVTSFLNFDISWNRGISLGVFSNSSNLVLGFLSFISLFIVFMILVYAVFEHKKGRFVGFEMLMIAGAISNLFDRIVCKAVLDFIDLHVLGMNWPTFNLADVWIVIGAIGILLRGVGCNLLRNLRN
jgi:signal peptidase II